MTDTLRVADGEWIEFNGQRIASILPKLAPTVLDALVEVFASIGQADDDADTIAYLEGRIEDLETQKTRAK